MTLASLAHHQHEFALHYTLNKTGLSKIEASDLILEMANLFGQYTAERDSVRRRIACNPDSWPSRAESIDRLDRLDQAEWALEEKYLELARSHLSGYGDELEVLITELKDGIAGQSVPAAERFENLLSRPSETLARVCDGVR